MIPDFVSWRERFLVSQATVEEYLDRCQSRYEALDADIRAFASTDWNAARQRAIEADARYRAGRPLSPIDGVPLGLKDIIDTAGLPTQMQSPLYEGHVAGRNAACVDQLIGLGAIMVGKTVTQEFACGIAGPTRNPHDVSRTPGGSSSGSAAAVAAGMIPFSLGTQTRASTIRPASYCGVYALKPTFGQVTMEGIHPVAPSHDTIGLFAASLRDLRLFYEMSSGRRLPRATVAKPRLLAIRTTGAGLIDADAEHAFCRFMEHSGLRWDDWDSPAAWDFDALLVGADNLLYDIMCFEMQTPYSGYAAKSPERLSRQILEMVEKGARMTASLHASLLDRKAQIRRAALTLLERYDGVVSLAAAGCAPVGLDYTGSRSYAIPWSLVGGPSMSLPLLTVGDLPVGLQLMGRPGDEAGCFEVAAQLDRQIAASGATSPDIVPAH